MSIKPNTTLTGTTKDQRLAFIKILNQAGVYEYRENYYSKPKYSAQQQLRSKGHYVDDDTLKVFGAKILDAEPILDGLFYYIRESKRDGFDGFERIHSYVYFDIFGNVVEKMREKAKNDECYSPRQLDLSDQAYFKINPIKYYTEKLAELAERKETEVQKYRDAINKTIVEVTS
jgi:hypothetical protein